MVDAAGAATAAENLRAQFRAATPRSAEIDGRALTVFPGGDTRTAAFHAPYPLTITHGEGPHLVDLDGRRYLDLIGNYTALVHGNAYPPIVEAARRQVEQGTAWPARNTAQVELAELLVERVTSVEQVRFTNSGTEATMLGLYLARAHTGRRKVLMARFGYHGSLEEFELGTFGHEGPETLLATYGDAESFEQVLAEHGDDIACVALEPVLGSGGVIEAPPGFLERVRVAAHAAGALLLLDEVITLRLAPGGAQARHGVTPDLTAMGKIMGGGFAVGAIGGRAELFEVTDPRPDIAPGRQKILHSGTFNGNPVTAAAGLVSMQHLTSDRIASLDAHMVRLRAGIEAAAAERGVPCSISSVGSMANVYLSDQAPAAAAERTDGDLIGAFHLACLQHGLFLAPRGLIALSTVMTDELIGDAIDRFGAVFDSLASGLR